jgi:hypothetical protein
MEIAVLDHVRNLQVLNHDRAVLFDVSVRDFVKKISALVAGLLVRKITREIPHALAMGVRQANIRTCNSDIFSPQRTLFLSIAGSAAQ